MDDYLMWLIMLPIVCFVYYIVFKVIRDFLRNLFK